MSNTRRLQSMQRKHTHTHTYIHTKCTHIIQLIEMSFSGVENCLIFEMQTNDCEFFFLSLFLVCFCCHWFAKVHYMRISWGATNWKWIWCCRLCVCVYLFNPNKRRAKKKRKKSEDILKIDEGACMPTVHILCVTNVMCEQVQQFIIMNRFKLAIPYDFLSLPSPLPLPLHLIWSLH